MRFGRGTMDLSNAAGMREFKDSLRAFQESIATRIENEVGARTRAAPILYPSTLK